MNNDDKLTPYWKSYEKHKHATGTSTYKLMFERDINTELDFMVKNAHKIHSYTRPYKNIKIKRSFSEGQTGLARNHSFN